MIPSVRHYFKHRPARGVLRGCRRSSTHERASTDWPAPTCASPSKVVRERGRWPKWHLQTIGDIPMAPTRAFWKGHLKLSLVTCPIALYTGTSATERVSFRLINKKTGHRLRQQPVDEVTREPVEGDDKGRGFEYAKNAYIPVDDDELEALAIESKHTIEIDSFVPREQIDQRYLDSPYYITPDGQVGQDAFAVIREAVRGKDMVALGRVVLAKRERVIMLQPWDKGLMATTLRYPYEIRDAKEYFDDIPDVKVEPDMLSWPSTSSRTRRRTSIPRSLSITTRKPSSRCSRRNRPACRYRASMSHRGRRTL
jgi:Ku protein